MWGVGTCYAYYCIGSHGWILTSGATAHALCEIIVSPVQPPCASPVAGDDLWQVVEVYGLAPHPGAKVHDARGAHGGEGLLLTVQEHCECDARGVFVVQGCSRVPRVVTVG